MKTVSSLEIRTLRINIEGRVVVMEKNFLRRCYGVILLEHGRKETICERLQVEKTLVDKKKICCYCHMQRMDDERLRKGFNWTPIRKRKGGRHKTRWKEGISKAMSRRHFRKNDNKKETLALRMLKTNKQNR